MGKGEEARERIERIEEADRKRRVLQEAIKCAAKERLSGTQSIFVTQKPYSQRSQRSITLGFGELSGCFTGHGLTLE